MFFPTYSISRRFSCYHSYFLSPFFPCIFITPLSSCPSSTVIIYLHSICSIRSCHTNSPHRSWQHPHILTVADDLLKNDGQKFLIE
ncbi:hypothetical protein C8R41DRAFT_208563 [Lentinula lateritia]|uniref:Uncharacterized protein n=1 Tax=Lentinula lateritia TaxID=40482 RepID=A0ABQ8VMB4_9AGAR|nr:hypothetical protein C8R41DRAFT_208563 [Lentinula lateritia]